MKMHVSNNMIALFAILLMLSSGVLNYFILIEAGEHEISGKATSAKIEVCNNRAPTLLFNCSELLKQGENYNCDINMFDYECEESCIIFDTTQSEISGTQIRNIKFKNICTKDLTLDKINISWTGNIQIRAINIGGSDIWSEAGPGNPLGVQSSGAELNPSFLFQKESEGTINYIDFTAPLNPNEYIIFKSFYRGSEKITFIDYQGGMQSNSFDYQICIPKFTFSLITNNPLRNELRIDPNTGYINVTIPITADDRYQRNNPYNIILYGDDGMGCSNSITMSNYSLQVIQDSHPPYFTVFSPVNLVFNMTETENRTFYARVRDVDNEDDDLTNDNNITFRWYINGTLVQEYIDIDYQKPFDMYKFSTDYTSAGINNIVLEVSDDIFTIDKRWIVTVFNLNRPPFFNKSFENQSWQENKFKASFYLDDYAVDYDEDDILNYEVIYHDPGHSIIVTIDSENRNQVIFSQPRNWFGVEEVSFKVIDNHGAFDISNSIKIEVTKEPVAQVQDSKGGGGGGGGAGGFTRCIPNWFCGSWEHCSPEGFMQRLCYDLNECGNEENKPQEVGRCIYLESCMNGKLDQGEEGVDCGGPCPPCGNCFDKIRNNGEEGVDCGGPCLPCSTCSDGIQNQGEVGVDCGGPCLPCPTCNDRIKNCHRQIDGSILCEEDIDCGGPCKSCVTIEKPMNPLLLSGTLKEDILSPAVVSISIGVIASSMIVGLFYKNIFALLFLFYKPFKKKKEYDNFFQKRKEDEIIQKSVNIDIPKEKQFDPKEIISGSVDLKNKIMTDIIEIDPSLPYDDKIRLLKQCFLSSDAKENIILMLDLLQKISYSGEGSTEEDINQLLTLGRKVSELLKLPENRPSLRFSDNYDDADFSYLKRLIKECREKIDSNQKNEALLKYKKITNLYDSSSEDIQEKLFNDIDKLYTYLNKKFKI